jgi:HEAT repeat protein
MVGAGVGLALSLCFVAGGLAERRKVDIDGHPSVDVDHLRILRARRDGDVDTLIAALEDEIDASLAATFLGKIGAVSAIPTLAPLLEAANPHHRASAVGALAMLDDASACPRIMEIAERDEVPWVRACATAAVGELSCDGGQVLQRALGDPDVRVRRTAVVVLMNTGQSDAIPALRVARKAEHWFSRGIYRKAICRLKRRSGRSRS